MQPVIKIQKDFFETEASMELPTDIGQLNEILKGIKSTGKMQVQYNQGSVQGVNITMHTKIPEAQASEIRSLLKIGDKIV